MNPYSEVYDYFLGMITEHQFLNFTDEELEEEFESKLRLALSKLPALGDIKMNSHTGSFSRPLTEQEKGLLAQAMLVEWLSQKVYNVQHMRNHMSSKDFTIFSHANHLKQMMELQQYADRELHYQLTQYSIYQLVRQK